MRWAALALLLADLPTVPAHGRLVDATSTVPGLALDLRYATQDNFLHRAVYPPDARCLLLRDTAQRLERAAVLLKPHGYRLKVFDCFRPRSVQYEMWRIMPKPGYVADPKWGSNHNRGAAVDLTLVQLDGGFVEMPTDFDSFSQAAHHGYSRGSAASRQHRDVLRGAMEDAGFKKNPMEWWHYDAPLAEKQPLLEAPLGADGGTSP